MRRNPLPTLALLLATATLPACRPAEAPPEEAEAAPEGTEVTEAIVFESGFEEGALDEWDTGETREGDEAATDEPTRPAAPEAEPAPQPPPAGD